MRKFEVLISTFAALACIGVTLVLGFNIGSYQELWPFPALYLAELILLALVAWFFSARDFPFTAQVNWGVAGAFLAFFILTGFSIGLFYSPFVVLFIAVGLLSGLRHKQKFWWHLVTLVLGGLAQAGLVILILQFVLKTEA